MTALRSLERLNLTSIRWPLVVIDVLGIILFVVGLLVDLGVKK